MERRNREIILFFEENEDIDIINGKIVRLYMNRITINEEERFEIAGVFHLAKVESQEPEIKRRKISNMSHMTSKWNYDWSIIENAFGKMNIFNWFNTDIHMLMGTSLYIGNLNFINSLIKLIRFWAENCSSRSSSFSLTFVAGRNYGLRTKVQVKEAYQNNHKNLCEIWLDSSSSAFASPLVKHFVGNPDDTLNNDLENFIEDLCREINIAETPIERKLVLYEMTNDDHRFMQSNCERFTVYLK